MMFSHRGFYIVRSIVRKNRSGKKLVAIPALVFVEQSA